MAASRCTVISKYFERTLLTMSEGHFEHFDIFNWHFQKRQMNVKWRIREERYINFDTFWFCKFVQPRSIFQYWETATKILKKESFNRVSRRASLWKSSVLVKFQVVGHTEILGCKFFDGGGSWLISLFHFMPQVSFYTPWKHQKTSGMK